LKPDRLLAGLIFAISNTVANVSGFLAPQLTGHLLDSDNSLQQWQLAFWISAIIYMPGFILFLIFGTDKLMPWAE
jgi:MFS family permease